jgi:hypothetical protein
MARTEKHSKSFQIVLTNYSPQRGDCTAWANGYESLFFNEDQVIYGMRGTQFAKGQVLLVYCTIEPAVDKDQVPCHLLSDIDLRGVFPPIPLPRKNNPEDDRILALANNYDFLIWRLSSNLDTADSYLFYMWVPSSSVITNEREGILSGKRAPTDDFKTEVHFNYKDLVAYRPDWKVSSNWFKTQLRRVPYLICIFYRSENDHVFVKRKTGRPNLVVTTKFQALFVAPTKKNPEEGTAPPREDVSPPPSLSVPTSVVNREKAEPPTANEPTAPTSLAGRRKIELPTLKIPPQERKEPPPEEEELPTSAELFDETPDEIPPTTKTKPRPPTRLHFPLGKKFDFSKDESTQTQGMKKGPDLKVPLLDYFSGLLVRSVEEEESKEKIQKDPMYQRLKIRYDTKVRPLSSKMYMYLEKDS